VDRYLTVTTAAGAALGAHRVDRGMQGSSGHHRHAGSGQGTTIEPLDGGALTLRGTRAPARGPAAAPPTSSLCRHGRYTSLVLTVLD
jgi:hypothetical protein